MSKKKTNSQYNNSDYTFEPLNIEFEPLNISDEDFKVGEVEWFYLDDNSAQIQKDFKGSE